MPGASAGRPTWMWGVPADAWSVRGPTHMDVGSACRCREHLRAGIPSIPGHHTGMCSCNSTHRDVGSVSECREHSQTDPQGCGECQRMPGAFADRPTGMWEVFANAGSIRGPGVRAIHGRAENRSCVSTHRDVGSVSECREHSRTRRSGHPWPKKRGLPKEASASGPRWIGQCVRRFVAGPRSVCGGAGRGCIGVPAAQSSVTSSTL